MSVILNITKAYSTTPAALTPQQSIRSTSTQPYHSEDSADFSQAARSLSEALESSSMRLAQIRAVRTEIENGTYETPERIEATARRLIDIFV